MEVESECEGGVTGSWVVEISRPGTARTGPGLKLTWDDFISKFARSLLVSGGGRLEKARSGWGVTQPGPNATPAMHHFLNLQV